MCWWVGRGGRCGFQVNEEKEKDSPVTPQEHTKLRRLLVGLGWKCEQTGPQHCAATGLQQVKKESGQVIRIFSFPTEEQLALIRWGDAALQSRIDGGSTKGLLFTCSSVKAKDRNP